MIGTLLAESWGTKSKHAAFEFTASALIVLSECIYRTLYKYFKLHQSNY